MPDAELAWIAPAASWRFTPTASQSHSARQLLQHSEPTLSSGDPHVYARHDAHADALRPAEGARCLLCSASAAYFSVDRLAHPQPIRPPSLAGPACPRSPTSIIRPQAHGRVSLRWSDAPWSSMMGASPWGVERLPWSSEWRIGEAANQEAFRGCDLRLRWHHERFAFADWL